MSRRLMFAVLLLAGLGLIVAPSAARPGGVKDVPVAVSFGDGYAIQGDGLGPYLDGVAGVSAVLVATGNLALKTNAKASVPVRMLVLDFTGACSGPCDPPFSTLTVPTFVSTSACASAGGLRDMAVGASQECNLNVNFGAAGLGWFVRFGEYDGTTAATVTRVSPATWSIAVPEGGVARLLSYPTKGRMVLTPRGDFAMSASMAVTLE
jgi:hypothetical protein